MGERYYYTPVPSLAKHMTQLLPVKPRPAGTAWDSMGQHGDAWDSMGMHGTAWGSMGMHGDAWDSMGQHGDAWDSMGMQV